MGKVGSRLALMGFLLWGIVVLVVLGFVVGLGVFVVLDIVAGLSVVGWVVNFEGLLTSAGLLVGLFLNLCLWVVLDILSTSVLALYSSHTCFACFP